MKKSKLIQYGKKFIQDEDELWQLYLNMTELIPERYIDDTFDDYIIEDVNKESFEMVEKWLSEWKVEKYSKLIEEIPYKDDDGNDQVYKAFEEHENIIIPDRNLILAGPQSTGKTMLANLIIKDVFLRLGRSVSVISSDYSSILEDYKYADFNEKRKILRSIKNNKLVVLDEVGSYSKITEDSTNLIKEIMNYRINHMLPTIIISNLSFSFSTDMGKLSDYIDEERARAYSYYCEWIGTKKRKK